MNMRRLSAALNYIKSAFLVFREILINCEHLKCAKRTRDTLDHEHVDNFIHVCILFWQHAISEYMKPIYCSFRNLSNFSANKIFSQLAF